MSSICVNFDMIYTKLRKNDFRFSKLTFPKILDSVSHSKSESQLHEIFSIGTYWPEITLNC